jgi:hypothetical protein
MTVATRQGTASSLRVAVDDPDRLLRFTRTGGSPQTIRARDLAQSAPWVLPPLRPGGEIVGYQPAAQVRPVGYQLETAGSLADLGGNWVIATGLTPAGMN